MRIPTWRIALIGGAIIILTLAGIGLVAAGTTPTAAPLDLAAGPASDSTVTSDVEAEAFEGRLGWRGRWALRAGRHLVHAEVTLVGRDGELVDIWLDHGTVQSIGGGSLVIAEAGDTTRTVSVDDATVVYVGREDGELGDVTGGAEVFVQSRVDGDAVLAKRILVLPADLARARD